MTSKNLSNKTVFITGGGSWIGKEIASLFSSKGANVFITGRNEDKLKQTCSEIKNNGGIASYIVADVSEENSIKNAIKSAIEVYGSLDVIIPNAAIYPNTQLTDIPLDEWNDVLSANLTGAFLTIKYATPFLQEQSRGRVIFISSVAGDPIGVKGYAHYCASKAGMNGLMRAAALELAKSNITVNSILPGNICNTERFSIPKDETVKMINKIPMGRIGQPTDIANLALFLASDDSSFITGQTFIVDGGECISTN